mmetsp:Transcript_6343/g.9238  ORF Transcript_6343/g.9238 Transcript_6343/m.9238 type:complete len:223 (-) Transcript_6343:45-713(-)
MVSAWYPIAFPVDRSLMPGASNPHPDIGPASDNKFRIPCNPNLFPPYWYFARACCKCFGKVTSPFDVESDPPAIIQSACPVSIILIPDNMAVNPDKHARDTVCPGIVFGKFKSITISLATFGAFVFNTTVPHTISSIHSGLIFVFFINPSTATHPNPTLSRCMMFVNDLTNGVRCPSIIHALVNVLPDDVVPCCLIVFNIWFSDCFCSDSWFCITLILSCAV